jgi:hypothetical protein
MHPYHQGDGRGKSGKVSIEVVRQVVDQARMLKNQGKRIRMKSFTAQIRHELHLDLGRNTISDILVANDLYKAETRRKRPRFYRNLCQRIPNSLLSLDGSELLVQINDVVEKFNVELGVDVGSFCHTGFGIHRTETSEAVIETLEAHRRQWGVPLGVIFDHGSANLSEKVTQYLKIHGIEQMPAGPCNPKGNGTDEGAFSQMKRILGHIRIDASSTGTLAKSVLEKLVSVYVAMRNQTSLRRNNTIPSEKMRSLTTDDQRQEEKDRLAAHKASKNAADANQPKRDRVDWLIKTYGLKPEAAEIENAYRSIRGYDMKAIAKSEEAFLKATNRDAKRKNLSYFFGILRNIQREMDNDHYREYCRNRYNYEIMLEKQRQKSQQEALQAPPDIKNIVGLAVTATITKARFIKESAERTIHRWTQELLSSARYAGPVSKKFQDAIGALRDIDDQQKEQVWGLINRYLGMKPNTESVTLVS